MDKKTKDLIIEIENKSGSIDINDPKQTKELRDLLVESVSKVSVEAKGDVTLLYSDNVNNSKSGSLVGIIAADQERTGVYHYQHSANKLHI